MKLVELLLKNQDAIVERWLDLALATYGGDVPATFKRQKDPFANPIGHSLRVGTRKIFAFRAMAPGSFSPPAVSTPRART